MQNLCYVYKNEHSRLIFCECFDILSFLRQGSVKLAMCIC